MENEMKASDLRIGNYVYAKTEKGKKIARVCFVTDKFVAAEATDGSEYTGKQFDGVFSCIEPITLTPEILEKNGFIQLEPSVNYDWWCIDNKDKFLVGFGFGKEEGRTATGWIFDTVGSFDYKRQIGVHELQNLLRLAGIEKDIEL